jgi:hypothetical protein
MLVSALFTASIPDNGSTWENFLGTLYQAIQKHEEQFSRISENVWILDLKSSMAPLGFLIAACERYAIPYGIVPFDDEPQWLPGGFDPKTIRGSSG